MKKRKAKKTKTPRQSSTTASRSAITNRARSRVFISHASQDAKLVSALLDLLQLGVGLPDRDVFCTSQKGEAPEIGRVFSEEVRLHLRSSKCVVAVLTESYWSSHFCVGELGAAWYDPKKQLVPLLVPPLGYDDLLGVANQSEALVISKSEDLDRLRDAIVTKLGMHGRAASTAKWNDKKGVFLKSLEELLAPGSSASAEQPPGPSAQRMMQEVWALNHGPKIYFHSDQKTKRAGVPYRVQFGGDLFEIHELLGLFDRLVTEASSSDDDLAFWRLLNAARNLRVATWELLKRPDCAWSKNEWLDVSERFATLEQLHGETVRRFWDDGGEVGVYDESGQFLGTATYIPPGRPNGAPNFTEGLLMGAPPSVHNDGRYTIEVSGRRVSFTVHGGAGGGAFFMAFR